MSGVERNLRPSEESLHAKVREGLYGDRRVYVAGEVVRSPAGMGWIETSDIIVAPINPIYDPEELNRFMDSLLPELPRSARDEARHYDRNSNFSLGKLYFDEQLGVRHVQTTEMVEAYQADALTRAGVAIGETSVTRDEELNRRVWVRVYPSSTIAQIVADYEVGLENGTVEPNAEFNYLRHWINPDQLQKLKGSEEIKKRFFGLLK